MISAILFISFFIFLILGVPIGICLGLSSVCAILYSGTSLTIVATNMYSGISKFLLLAIPFFVLSGNIMAKAGISKRLIKFVDTCVGHKKRRYRHRMCYRSLLLRRHLRFRPCNCCSSWRRTDPCNGRTGWFLRTILHSTYGYLKFHRHRHPAKYRLRCICLHHRHIHRRHVHGRYRTRSSYGRGTGNRSNAGSKETQYQTIQRKSLRQRTLGRF